MRFVLFVSILLFCYQCVISQEHPLEVYLQKGHSEAIYTIEFTPDSKHILSAGKDKSIKLWEVATGNEIRTFSGHLSYILCLKITKDGKYFFSAGTDAKIIMWELATGKIIKIFEGHQNRINSLCLNNDETLLISTGCDWQGFVWDIKKAEVIRKFKVKPDKGTREGTKVLLSKDEKSLILGNDNSTVSVINFQTGEPDFELKSRDNFCGGCPVHIDLSKNGKYLLTGSNKGPLRIWDLKSKSVKYEFAKEQKYYYSVQFTPDGKKIMTSSPEDVIVYDINSQNQLIRIKADEKQINDAKFSFNGKYIAVASSDKTIKLYNSRNGKLIRTFKGFLLAKNAESMNFDAESFYEAHIKNYIDKKTIIKLSPDNKYLLKGKMDSTALFWNMETGKTKYHLKGHNKVVICYDIDKHQNYIATAGGDKIINIYDYKTGKLIQKLKGHRELIFDINFSNDGKRLVSGSWDGSARIWNVKTGEELTYIRMQARSPYTVRFSPNDLYLIIAALDGELEQWEPDSKRMFRSFIGHSDIVCSIEFSKDNNQMITASWDNSVKVWDLYSGAIIGKFIKHNSKVNTAAIMPDGKMAISGGNDNKARLWEITTGKEIRIFKGHSAAITSLQITSDGSTLITCDINSVIKFWDINTGKEIMSYYILDSKNKASITTTGFFDATEGAKKHLLFIKGLKSYNLDQFFEDFYRPKLYEKAMKSRGMINQNYNINDKLKKSPPPNVRILNEYESNNINKEQIELNLEVIDQGGGVDEIKIVQNGKVLPVATSKKRSVKAGKSYSENVKINLLPGENIIKVTAFSKERIESSPAELSLEFISKENYPDCYVLAIGINKYKNNRLNLNYAKDDAMSFAKAISKKSKRLFNILEINTLYDLEANKQNILEQLKLLTEKVKINDVFIFYYAGHGAMVDDNFYFIPSDCPRLYDVNEVNKKAIIADEIQEQFKNIKALKQVVIIDACQSGGATEKLATRGAADEKALAQLSRAAGVHVLASAGSEQYATEFKELGHGLFTYVLLDALNGKADGAPLDGKVTIYELKSYLDDQVPVNTQKFKGETQYPYTFSKGNDFPLTFK